MTLITHPGRSMLLNGHNLFVEQAGEQEGLAVVLLHHGLGSMKAWRRQLPALVRAGFCVVAYDRWGYGGSDGRECLDVPNFTSDLADLHALLDQLSIRSAALVGHSDGGTMALDFAIQQPGRVTCLVTVAAHIYVELKMESGILDVRQAFEIDERFRSGLRAVHGDKYRTVFHNWFDGWYRIGSLGWDMRTALGQIRCPVLVVQGEDDEHATPQHAMDIAGSIPGAELWLVNGARHMLPQENYTEFNPRLIRFLSDHCRN